ncbi:MAG: uroporphyrinogen decarboxylase family protein [Spirochaetia bacterium]
MTSRERVQAAFGHSAPDRTPVFEYILLPPVAESVLGRPFVEYLAGMDPWLEMAQETGFECALRRYAEARVEIAARLGHDMIFASPNPVPGASYMYDPLSELGARFEVAHEGDPVQRLKDRNRRVEQTMMGALPQDSLLVYDLLRKEMERRGLDLPILAPAYFHGIWTDSDLMQVMLIEPEEAREHFRLATRRSLAVVADYARRGIEMIGIGGDFAGTRLLISPECYRSFIVPEIRACAEAVRAAGAWSVNASDGDLWPVMDDFLLGCGVDAYLEIDMGAGMDLARLRQRYGTRITFLGNMDCGRILSFSPPEEVARVTREILKAGGTSGGHIFTASNAITSSVPPANYLAMVNAYRETFELPPVIL